MADKKQRTAVFKGLNRMPYIGDGEMRNMRNLSSDAYPFITTRKGRKPYTFITKIPSPEGEAYRDVERLPVPCIEEDNNVYKVTTDAVAPEYVSGGFYYYDGSSWVEGKIKKELYGVTEASVVASGEDCLIDSTYRRRERTGQRYPYYASASSFSKCSYYGEYWEESPLSTEVIEGKSTTYVYKGLRTKYVGETTERWVKGKTYVYTMYVNAYWTTGTISGGNNGGEVTDMPVAAAHYARNQYYYKYTGETTEEFTKNKSYKCVVDSYCAWEECESQYDVVEVLPEAPEENQQVRFVSTHCGAPMQKGYYLCEVETDVNNNFVYFYSLKSEAEDYIEVGYLSPVSADREGVYYNYIGPEVSGEFARCYYNESFYDWEVIEHPLVERTVTLNDWLDNYDGSGLTKILEIGNFRSNLVALIIDGNGEYKLYYNEQLWPVNNVSEEAGKKLVTVGSKLIVGEGGCYLHLKENKAEDGTVTREIEFFKSGEAFSCSINAENFYYGNGGDRERLWEASGDEDGIVYIKLYAPWGEGAQLKALYEGLKTEGTDFSVYAKKAGTAHKQYLTATKVTLEEKKLILAWIVGDREHRDYADVLTIKATGGWEEFNWYRTNGDTLVFESTDPHYYDVVAWKKRLWGYRDNVFFGTVQDIFDDYGIVDWNTGDNTYTEAISQPLWQGADITGIAALMSGLVYFKEDSITVVTGNYPAIMSSDTIPCRGLPAENRRSVAVGNEAVYYLGRNGVMRFDGGIPRCISQEVKISGTEAVGASDGNKYWLSLKEDSGEYALYVYDINYGIWHKEDCTQADSFVMLNGEMHMAVGTEVYNLNAPREDVPWECEFWYDEGTHQRKKYKQFAIRGDVGDDCELWLKADDGEWRLIGSPYKGSIKLIPFDCVELSLKLKGKGRCEIKSVDRTFEIVE